MRECGVHGRPITKLKTPIMRRITKTGEKNSGELYPDFGVPYVIPPNLRNRRNVGTDPTCRYSTAYLPNRHSTCRSAVLP